MKDTEKITELNKRLNEMSKKFYKIHSLAAALVEYEASPEKDDNTVSNVSENLGEIIKEVALAGVNVVSARVPIA